MANMTQGPKRNPDAGRPTEISKFLSYVLRHAPESIALELDAQGWASVDDLLRQAGKAGKIFSREELQDVVDTNDKKRFAFSTDGARIRASQGHSVSVDLGLVTTAPPLLLYHGTATRFLDSILREGLKPGSRQKVHLSADVETAIAVGKRHGKPVVLRVASGEMHRQGVPFWRADNGVWLTDAVPSSHLEVVSE